MSLWETAEEHDEEIDAIAHRIWHAIFANASMLQAVSHEQMIADVTVVLAPLSNEEAAEALEHFDDEYNPGRFGVDEVVEAVGQAITDRK